MAKSNRVPLLFLLGAALFAASYGQAPLYYSNQNQYFLHGLARAGEGELQRDWLANTDDPTPLFSGLVELTARFLHPWAFHVYYALLFGAYAAALLGVFVHLAGPERARRSWPLFVLLFVLIHSALARCASYRLLGLDYPWYFQAGVAGQYILGAMFQPSTFGVLLVVAVWLFLRERIYLAAGAVALCATLHSTYLLHAGMLTLGFLIALWWEGKVRQALGVGLLALVLVLPITAHVLITFRPTSAEAFRQAQHILVHFRLPHHCRPDLWLDPIAGLQIAWMVLGIVLAGSTRLRLILGIPFLLGAALTLIQAATKSDTLAVLFPWRISAVLVPLATTIILTRLVLIARSEGSIVRATSALLVASLAGAGLLICVGRHAFPSDPQELRVMQAARDDRRPGDVYLLPVKVPDLVRRTRGSLSSDFKPLPARKSDRRLIPPELQRFRLATGIPIVVDFKSIPYRDVDLIEWHERIQRTQTIEEWLARGEVGRVVEWMRKNGVTHLIRPADEPVQSPELEQLYEDSAYRIYRLNKS